MTRDPHSRKVVFITGGMSGLGFGLASMYVAEGCDVALFDLAVHEQGRAELQSACTHTGQMVRAWAADVSDVQAIKAAIAEAVSAMGAPDLLINSAGIQRADTFMQQAGDVFEAVIRVNLLGSRHVAAAVLPHMRSGSHIAFISSLAGLTTSYAYAAYCASKWGVVGMANVLRMELKPLGIDVSVICPPEVSTPMVAEEARTMHPVTRELKDVAGTLSLHDACVLIKAGLDKRRFKIVPGAKARLAYLLTRYVPDALQHAVIDSKVSKILDRLAKPA